MNVIKSKKSRQKLKSDFKKIVFGIKKPEKR